MRQAVQRRKQQLESNACRGRPSPNNRVIIISNEPSLSNLTSKDNGLRMSTSRTTSSGPTNPKPKQKQTCPTTSAIQQRRIDDLKAKRHKSDVHLVAMRLYGSKRQKPDGMSIWQVVDVITSRFETCPSKATIACYAKNGLISWTRHIWWRGSRDRVDCWARLPEGILTRAEHPRVGKSWSGAAQPELPAEPKGPALDWQWQQRSTGLGLYDC